MKRYKKYTNVSDVIIEDKELNWNEKGLLINIIKYDEMFSRLKEDYSYINSWLMQQVGINRTCFKMAIKHLKELGYISSSKKFKHYEINWGKLNASTDEETETNIINLASLKEEVEDILPIEEEPVQKRKDYNRLNCRLAGAERMKLSWFSFKTANLDDLMDAGFSEEEIEEAFFQKMAV